MAFRNWCLLPLFLILLFSSPFNTIKAEESFEVESYEYKSEVTRLMDIIINYLYTEKDRFLRELVSNGVDALEKIRLQSIGNDELVEDTPEFHIQISADKENQTITITDTGIGMTKFDLINNLGTVAKSGTTNFLESMAESGDINLIGQFGVGFYSAFLVADKVTVYSKNPHDDQYVWESSADAKFTIHKDPNGNTLGRGTKIVLHVKKDATEFLEEAALTSLINKFSQFMPFPIYIWKEKTIEVDEEPMVDTDEKTEIDHDDVEIDEDADDDDEPTQTTPKKVKKQIFDWEHVNVEKPLWLKPKSEITAEEYVQFYQTIVKDGSKPLSWIHFSAEGEIDFKALLYIPQNPPTDFYDGYMQKQTNVKLYARRVLVTDTFDELLPRYLSFVKGVIDSDDVPLNVSREQLQEQKVLKAISKKMVRKIMELIKELSNESYAGKNEIKKEIESMEDGEEKDKKVKELKDYKSTFDTFWSKFGNLMNLGCYDDKDNGQKLAPILQYSSNKNVDHLTNLDNYVDNMVKDQTLIYYIAGESLSLIEKSPLLQTFNEKNIEVIYATDNMSEACLQKLGSYKDKKIISIQKEKLELPENEEEKDYFTKVQKLYKPLVTWFKNLLKESVKNVEVSKTLVNAPCAVVASTYGYSASMAKSFKSQTFADKSFLDVLKNMKVFQINPNHPVMIDLLEKVKSIDNNSTENEEFSILGKTLYETALLSSGFDLDDSELLTKQIYTLLGKEYGIDFDAEIKSIDVSNTDLDDSDKTSNEPSIDDLKFDFGDTQIPESFSSIDPETGLPKNDYSDTLEQIALQIKDKKESMVQDEL